MTVAARIGRPAARWPRIVALAAACVLAVLAARLIARTVPQLGGTGAQAPDAAARATASPVGVPAEIRLHPEGHGSMLSDARGMTLYTFGKDPRFGKPACELACAKDWPPLLAPPDAQPFGDWTIALRANGERQWAFQGKPLYRYVHDTLPGEINGDEQLQVWAIALKPLNTPPGFGVFKSPKGQLLVDQKRMTLYVSDADTAKRSACAGECARTWKPVEAWGLAVPAFADWSLIGRADGTRQWAYKGRPLYRFANDFNPGELTGASEKGWHPVVLQPPPPIPSWITLQESDGGLLYATPEGKTIYMQDLNRSRGFGIGFAKVMERPDLYRALIARDSDQPIGFFSIVTNESGERQWTYKGMRLYTYKLDREPGDINGLRNMDRVWRTIMASGQTMAGTGT